MGLIITPEQYERRRQPQVGVRVNRRSPLSRGLTTAVVPYSLTEMYCAVRRRRVEITSTGATMGLGPAGVCYRVGNSKKITCAENLIPGITHSAVLLMRPTATVSSWKSFFYTKTDTGSWGLDVHTEGAPNVRMSLLGGYDVLTGVKAGLEKNRLSAIGWAHSQDANLAYCAVDGSLRSGDGTGAPLTISGITVGYAPYFGYFDDMEFYGLLAWNRLVSRGELMAVTRNFFGRFE